jgi:dihydrofolate synthase/folylpolyglutamate synthase
VVLLDAAHNPAGAETLARAVIEQFGAGNACFILGILHDKDYRTMCKLLAPLAGRVLIVPVHSERAASTSELAEACFAAKPGISVTECDSLAGALAATRPDEKVVIAGSLYLAGEALELLGIESGGRHQERRLNEYGGRHQCSSSTGSSAF